jgi:hypothetical protein
MAHPEVAVTGVFDVDIDGHSRAMVPIEPGQCHPPVSDRLSSSFGGDVAA